ncbi:TetR/AcrR family transcriptional regulator [Streptomyces sp. SID13726]|uniref:TetR/AcrR family transcriptional regulator n=1 Tax=Streptomyces sp. SID13726 TaxID=2706058 RepID=UPI0013B93C63|nr:TetR/AcrR family transcriptional regulator [Streptomyces sp. SID13726]NEA98985.1 TetR/AcrR family transcriptional regulator [Streptomyces sp. SID13726]
MSPEPSGRPRDPAVHRAILEATRDLLVEQGYRVLTMDRVATRAGVGKQTVYRRWPSKAPLVAEAVLDGFRLHQPVEPPDTGDLDADLTVWLRQREAFMAAPHLVELVRALAIATAEDPDAADALHLRLTRPERDRLVARLRAGVEAGQVDADADLEAAVDALIGSIVYRILTRVPAEEAVRRGEGLLGILLAGIRKG